MDFEDFLYSPFGMTIITAGIPLVLWLIYFLLKTYKEGKDNANTP